VVGLVDIGTNRANGIAFAVSAQVAHPLLQAWQTAPQPVSTGGCSNQSSSASPQASVPPPQPTVSPSTYTYNGQAFSIDYPSDWQVKNAERPTGYGTDTTFVSPSDSDTVLRVDVTPNPTASDPQTAAQPVINAIEQEPGYQQIDLSPTTFDGFPALHWEFVVRESGALLHKEDVFFIDTSNGDGVAVLTSAPADQYPGLSSEFSALAQTLSMN
jgi:hypothetical protein